METDFDKAITHLKDALTELKKGEHDQLSSFYEQGYHSTDEIIKSLIKGAYTTKRRWESEPMEFTAEIEMCECGYHPKDESMQCDL